MDPVLKYLIYLYVSDITFDDLPKSEEDYEICLEKIRNTYAFKFFIEEGILV